MSNNKQPVATQGLTTEDHECIIISLLDCAKSGETRRNQSRPSICEVPRILREHNESSFIPRLVSIGPIHREDPKLKEFQWLKEHYLDDLLRRCDSRPKETLEACVLKVKTLLPDIKESYAMIKKCSDAELVRIMVIDGCFILEFCFKNAENENMYSQMQNIRIAMDLMLLENQVPFLVLQALFDCCIMGERSFTLIELLDTSLLPYIQLFGSPLPENNSILSNVLEKYLPPYIKRFCSLLPEKISTTDVDSDLPEKIPTTNVDSDSIHDHVLGYLHKHYQPVVEESSNRIHAEASKLIHADAEASKLIHADAEASKLIHPDTEASKLIHADAEASKLIHADAEASKPVVSIVHHSTVALDRSGIIFKPYKGDNWSMTIEFQSTCFSCLPWFCGKPTLLMPPLVIIDDFTELILSNFIAYEQSVCQDRCYFTSYAHAMDMLIDTQEDVAILAEKVLVNQLCSNREVADMINKIGKNISVTDFLYTKEFEQMDKYYKRLCPKIKRTFFSNPWNVINLIVGIIVFIATVVGAIFAVLEYFR